VDRSPPPPPLEPWIPAAAVRDRIAALAEEIHAAAPPGLLHLLHVEQGARRFADALAAHLSAWRPLERSSILASRTQGTTLGPVRLAAGDLSALAARHVLVVDDILDQGRTLDAVLQRVAAAAPASVRVTVLVERRGVAGPRPRAHHVGIPVDEGWVVGFGMDLDGRFRDRDDLCRVDPTTRG